MASKTDFLKLIKPALGEYRDNWHIPMNANSDALDVWAQGVEDELVAARFSAGSLQAFLSVGHNTDGSLKATPEVLNARNSGVLGDKATLSARLDAFEKNVASGYEGAANLRDTLALREYGLAYAIISGSKDANGYPTWAGFTSANVNLDGATLPVVLAINGYHSRIRKLESVTLSGGAATYYVYAQYQPTGVQRVDGDATTAPPASPTGTTSVDTDLVMRIFTDSTKDFTVEDVKAGDILTIIGSADAGEYVVAEVAPSGFLSSQLRIVGKFPTGGLSSLNYTIRDPLAVTYGFSATLPTGSDKLVIAEADFDGSAVTAVRARHFKYEFVGEWRAIDVTSVSTFEQIWNHKLGSDLLDVVVQVSQANDGTQPVEELSVAQLANTTALNFSNTLSFNPGTFTPGTGAGVGEVHPNYNPLPSLTGNVTSSLTGAVTMTRSVAVKWTRNQVFVKNVTPSVFYTDYGAAVRQTGFIRVIIRKRG